MTLSPRVGSEGEEGEGRGLQKVCFAPTFTKLPQETVWASRCRPAVYHGHPQTSWWAPPAHRSTPRPAQGLPDPLLWGLCTGRRRSQRAGRAGALTVDAFPKRLTCLVVSFLLKMVSEGEESRRNQQFGGGLAQNKLPPAHSAGFPGAGRPGPTEMLGSFPLSLGPHPATLPASSPADGSRLPAKCSPWATESQRSCR